MEPVTAQLTRHGTGETAQLTRHGTGETAQLTRHGTGETARLTRHGTGETAQLTRHGTGETAQLPFITLSLRRRLIVNSHFLDTLVIVNFWVATVMACLSSNDMW